MGYLESKVTHKGKWIIDEDRNIVIDCYVTDNRRRLMSLRGTARAMGLKGGGSSALVRNLNSKWIEEYLSPNLKQWLNDMQNSNLQMIEDNKGKEFYPFDGDLFVDLCKAYITAEQDGVFNSPVMRTQSEVADRLLNIMSAFAKVGIVALIDEITGYQYDREKDELQKILAKYVRQEFLPWTQRFPEEFYKEMFRLKGWKYKGNAKPPLVGKYTNKLVYEVLPENVLEELKKVNPIHKNGRRKKRHHQFLTEETGIPHLDRHLASIVTLMRASDNWETFEMLFEKVFKKEEILLQEKDN